MKLFKMTKQASIVLIFAILLSKLSINNGGIEADNSFNKPNI